VDHRAADRQWLRRRFEMNSQGGEMCASKWARQRLINWCGWRGSNPQPLASESGPYMVSLSLPPILKYKIPYEFKDLHENQNLRQFLKTPDNYATL
jgi:hypothetical protein